MLAIRTGCAPLLPPVSGDPRGSRPAVSGTRSRIRCVRPFTIRCGLMPNASVLGGGAERRVSCEPCSDEGRRGPEDLALRRGFTRLPQCPSANLRRGAPYHRGHPTPFRVPCRFRGRTGYVVIDQIRTIDRECLGPRLGNLTPPTLARSICPAGDVRTVERCEGKPGLSQPYDELSRRGTRSAPTNSWPILLRHVSHYAPGPPDPSQVT